MDEEFTVLNDLLLSFNIQQAVSTKTTACH